MMPRPVFFVACVISGVARDSRAAYSPALSSLSDPLDVGILLLANSTQPTDVKNIGPALNLAFLDAKGNYSVDLHGWFRTYTNECHSVETWDSVSAAVDLMLNNNVDMDENSDYYMWPMNPVLGNLLVGPGCSPDFQSVAMATQRIMTILITGAAESIYSTQDKNFTVRTGYNLFSMWFILTKGMAPAYQWMSIAGLYNSSDTVMQTQYDSMIIVSLNRNGGFLRQLYQLVFLVTPEKGSYFRMLHALRLTVAGGDVTGFVPLHKDGIPGGRIVETACDFFPVTPENEAKNEAVILDCLGRASQTSRIIVLLMSPPFVRKTMLLAQKHNMVSAEYMYLVMDPLRDGFLSVPQPVWQTGDSDDASAKEAFKSLFVLAMAPYEQDPKYLDLARRAKAESVKKFHGGFKMNFWVASFYDAVMVYAKALSDLSKQYTGHVMSCMTKQIVPGKPSIPVGNAFCNSIVSNIVNSSHGYQGASGTLIFDEYGDRQVKFDLYAMVDVVNGTYSCVAQYDPSTASYTPLTDQIPWPGGSLTPPKNVPDCGYDGLAPACATPFPTMEVALGVVIPIVVGLLALAAHLIRMARAQAKSDHEWIVPLRQLKFRRTKKLAEGDAASHASEEHAADDGHSMQGMSMGASMGNKNSMGASMAMTASMRKKFMLMSDFFGSHNKHPVVLRWTSRRRVVVTRKVLLEVRIVRKMHHDNVARFVGGCVEDDNVCVLYEMCSKGPLGLMFESEGGAKLDWTIRLSWIRDIVNGMLCIHASPVGPHGRFTSIACFIDSRFVLKITDYGLASIFTPTVSEYWMAKRDPAFSAALLWTCPEKLRADASGSLTSASSKEGDVYSFAIVLQEIIVRGKPFSMYEMSANEVVDEVRKGMSLSGVPFRPKIVDHDLPAGLMELCTKCWMEDPSERPSFEKIKTMVRTIGKAANMGDQTNIMDIFMQQMEESGYALQVAVEEKDQELLEQKERSDRAFMLVFPWAVAERVMQDKKVKPALYKNATLMMADIMGFETLCVESKPAQITKLLNDFYGMLDELIAAFDCFKTEHNAETVLVAAGIFGEPPKHGAREIARLALFSMVEIRKFVIHHRVHEQAKLRIGPVVMTALNLAAPRFGVCGITLKITERLLRTCDQLKIHASAATKTLLEPYKGFRFSPSPVSPIYLADENVEVDGFWLLDEEGNLELKYERTALTERAERRGTIRRTLPKGALE